MRSASTHPTRIDRLVQIPEARVIALLLVYEGRDSVVFVKAFTSY